MQRLYDPLIRSPASLRAERSFSSERSISSPAGLSRSSRRLDALAAPRPEFCRDDASDSELGSSWEERDRAEIAQRYGREQARAVAAARASANRAQTAVMRRRRVRHELERADRGAPLASDELRELRRAGAARLIHLATGYASGEVPLQHRLLDRWRHEQGAGAVRFGAVPRLSAKPLPPRSFNSLPLSGSRNQNQTLIITNR